MKNETFKTFIAILIAIVTVLSALVTWRVSVAKEEASSADSDALLAVINAEEAHTLNTVTTMEHFGAFLHYTRHNELGNHLYEAWRRDPDNAALEQQKSDAWGIAYGLQSNFFPSRFLLPDGTYDSQRELDEAWAEAQRNRDTRSDLHYLEADEFRTKANLLVGTLILLGIAFWFLTLAQAFEHKIKYLFVLGGGFFMVAAAFATLVIEVVM